MWTGRPIMNLGGKEPLPLQEEAVLRPQCAGDSVSHGPEHALGLAARSSAPCQWGHLLSVPSLGHHLPRLR